MDFKLTEEQELLVKSLTDLLQREVPESLTSEIDEKHEFPWKPWQALADNGILGLGIPEEYGGTPTDIQTMTLVCETLGKYSFPLGVVYGLGVITIRDIMQYGSEEIKKEVLGGFVKGDLPVALGISEPQAGSDAAGLKTTATYDGDDVVFNGQKIYCTLSKLGKYILLMTRDPKGESPYKSMSMWLVPTNTPGLRFNNLPKTGWYSVPTFEVFIDNVRVPRKNLVGVENCGWPQLMANFEIERLALTAVCVGAAEAGFEDAATYANQRVQFGQPVGNNQAIQHKLTDMAITIENMRNFCYKVAWMMDTGLPVRYEHAMCKLYGTQGSFQVLDDAMQIMGGLGYMKAHRVERLWRDVRVMRIGGGTDEIMYNIAGPQILKKYRSK
ncbi:MAG TPA: acyl-CoA dehydrogenase family protein [Anaerolineaceae bacterium]|jgi:alkylation response protein AidB-like acyl-CoA dehydrogenase